MSTLTWLEGLLTNTHKTIVLTTKTKVYDTV
jgi:hypothetical protein